MRLFLASAILSLSAFGAQAGTLNFTDDTFAGTETHAFGGGTSGPIIEFTESDAGVLFTFTGGQFREVGNWDNGINKLTPPYSLAFGGGGGNTANFSFTVSEDVILTGFSGLGQEYNTSPIWNLVGLGVSSLGNAFSAVGNQGDTPTAETFVGGPLSLTAGETYTWTTTNNSASTLGFIHSMEFTTAAVPLPATLPLLTLGLGALALGRRRKV